MFFVRKPQQLDRPWAEVSCEHQRPWKRLGIPSRVVSFWRSFKAYSFLLPAVFLTKRQPRLGGCFLFAKSMLQKKNPQATQCRVSSSQVISTHPMEIAS